MANYGVTKRYSRDKAPVVIVRGDYLTEPGKLTSLAPAIDAAAIKEGMVIVKDTGNVNGISTGGAWRKAVAADAPVAASETRSFFIARHDQDSHDVQAAGGLVGLNCSDDFELQTGYYDAGVTWAVDMPITVGDGGIITEAATAGDVIIGYVTKIGTATANAIPYVGKTPSTATAAASAVIQFRTARNGQVVAA
jgi:hypothetical protein